MRRLAARRPRRGARRVLVADGARAAVVGAGAIDHCWRVMWDLVRGAAQLKQPTPAELGRRYTELLAENLGQPGFRELLIAVHDVDAHRDLRVRAGRAKRAGAIWSGGRRSEAAEARRAEVFDLAGVARDHLRGRRRGGADACRSPPTGTRVTFARRRLLARRDASALRSAGQPDRGCSTS